MSEIIKTEAVVLSKMDYRDSSNILSLYTYDFGRMSAILKGGRSPKSKSGHMAEPLNHIQVILYKKETRDLQIISEINLISYFPAIKEDLERLKFSLAILELVKRLTPENEANIRLFNGLARILLLLNTSNEHPKIIFGRFFLFFLKEIGYEIQLNNCSSCQNNLIGGEYFGYNSELGIFCKNCMSNFRIDFNISQELFNYLLCLNQNIKADSFKSFTADRAIVLLEKHLNYYIPDFRGINSLRTLM